MLFGKRMTPMIRASAGPLLLRSSFAEALHPAFVAALELPRATALRPAIIIALNSEVVRQPLPGLPCVTPGYSTG